MKLLSITLLFVCYVLPIASQTIITDRPDQTESSSTISRKSLQIETGILVGFTSDQSTSERQLLAPTTLFRYGISNKIELRVLSQFESTRDQSTERVVYGISDLEIGFKAQLLQKQNINTEIAFLSHLTIPTGSLELTRDSYGTINKLSIGHQLTPEIGIGYNIGYNYFGEGNGDFTYSVALGIPVTDKVAVYVEPYGEWVEFDDHKASFDAGFTYLIKETLQTDFSFGTGINHSMNYISLGLSVLIQSDR